MSDELKELKKDELIELVSEYECLCDWLEIKLCSYKGIKKGRREQVKEVLIKEKRISVGDIGKRLGMSCRNVSSYLCYLRKEGLNIGTDSKGRKFIELDEVD